MSHIVQSLEHALEAGVKGFIGIAEGYIGGGGSGACSNPESPSVDNTVSSGSIVTHSHDTDSLAAPAPIPIDSASAHATAAAAAPPTSSSSSSHAAMTSPVSVGTSSTSLAARLALVQDTLVQFTDVQSGWIYLQSTYLDSAGGQRRVRSFGLRNVSTTTVNIEVGSDLGSQVVFWVGADDAAADVPESSSVSSASSLSNSAGSPSITLSIPAGAVTTIFLAFLPSTSGPSTPAGASTPSSEGGFTPRVLPASADVPVPGNTRLPSAAASAPGSILSDGMSTATNSAMSTSGLSSSTRDGATSATSHPRRSDPIHRSFSVHGSVLVHATAARAATTPEGLSPPEALATLTPAHQNISLPFFATVCRSFFSAAAIDPATSLVSGPQLGSGQLVLDFGTDNIVGNEVHRDILLVNRSEIDLVWTTTVVNSPFKDSVWFSLRDLDSENVFGVDTSAEPVPLPALSSRHLRLLLRASAPVADFEFEFVISNLHQSGNVVTCKAVGSCQATAQDDTLRIQSGSALDYGQIPDGMWAKKLIATKNVGDRPIDVHFSATPGYEVVFRLAGVAGEDIDSEDIVPVRPVRDKRTETLSRTSTRDTRDSIRARDSSGGSFTSQAVATASARSQLLTDATSVSSAAVETDEWSALGTSDREGSGPPSRPLSRVTSRSSSYRPSRNDNDSDDDEHSPPLFATTSADAPVADMSRPSDNLGDRDIPNQIEELTMRPGTEYRVFAMYRPARDLVNPPEIAGALRTSTFKVFLDSAPSSQRSRPQRSRKVIHCTAESCTSIITVPSGNLIDFGEVTVGACKTTSIQIENLSALSARVEISAISKVLMTNRNVIIIPPYETVNERVDFFPRRINDRYEKQVFVRNLLNRANNQLIEVHSKNVDVYNVTLHSHLYRILTPSGSNFVDFGSVVINSPSVRTVQFQNLTHKPLTLDLSASQPEDVELYIKRIDAPSAHAKAIAAKYDPQADGDRPTNGNLKERFVESLQDQGSSETKPPTKSKHRDKSVAKEKKEGDKASHAASHLTALKKGHRGRPVQLYGNAVVFKDRSLLDDQEYLDLASGPPGPSHHRILPQSKRAQLLETIALEDKSLLSGHHPRVPKLDFAASAKSSGLVGKETKMKKSKSAAGTKRDPSTPTKSGLTRSTGPPVSPSASPRQQLLKNSSSSSTGAKSPALTGKRIELKTDPTKAEDVTKLTPEELIVALEHHDARRNQSTVTHFTPEEEEQYVRRLIALRKELQNTINTGKFVPARVLTVPPGASRQVVVVLTPNGSTRPHVTTRAKRAESRIYIKVMEYDQSLLSNAVGHGADLTDLPVRDLVIRSSCVRSVLEVQQSSINFGTCERGDVKSRTIVIHNKSDCVGVFRMRTSGSIASGNLKLGLGRYGVVSAFGRKEVASFSFTPSLVGNFQETIVVENVLDSYNDQNVLVKATVRKMPAFTLDVTKLDFAPAQPDTWPAASAFVITNTSKTDRTFVIEAAEPSSSAFAELSLSRDEKDAGQALSKGEEEEVEGLLQKLKIARRKNKPDKIAKYEKRLGELGIVTAPADDAAAAAEADTAIASGNITPTAGEVQSVPSITVTLQANKKAKILVNLVPSASGSDAFTSSIKVYERKNTDETVTIDVSATPKASEPAATSSTLSESSDQDPLNVAIMRHCLELTLQCPVSPTAFCVGSTLFLPASSPLFDKLKDYFPTFPDPTTGAPAGLVLADGYSRQIPGNTHAEANALANFRERMTELTEAEPETTADGEAKPAPRDLPDTAEILAQSSCYATMEPCSVRTSGGPSCALELVRAHVKTVFLGVEEPPDFVQCEGVRILETGGVEVRRVVGLEEDCLRLARRGRT